MAPKTQVELIDEAQELLCKHLLGRWTIDELFEIEKARPGRISSLLALIGQALADFLFAAAPFMHSEPGSLSSRMLTVIADMEGFYTACIDKETDPAKKMLIQGARYSAMGTIRQFMHDLSVQERGNRYMELFKANEQKIRECLDADSPSLVDMGQLFTLLTGHSGEYDPEMYYPDLDMFLAWMYSQDIIDNLTYSYLI